MLTGKGDGTFDPATDHTAGDGPNSVAVGDLDRDGNPDLAIANLDSNGVSVLSGNGDDTFDPKTDHPTGSGPFSVAVGDFDRDGNPDLATANAGSNDVSVLLGRQAVAANDDLATVGEDSGATAFDVLANDSGATEITAASDPANGTANVIQGVGGDPDHVSYTPGPDYCNDPGASPTDDFTYTVNGGDTATVAVIVTCADDDAVAVDDARTVAEDSGATPFDVLLNDTDPDGGGAPLVASVTQPANGTVVVTGGGTALTYAPDANYCNDPGAAPTDDFTYTLNGGSQGEVAVTVTCVDEASAPADKPPVKDSSAPPAPKRCRGLVATIEAKPGGAPTSGTEGRDVIVGTDGDDRIRGLGGNDVVCAGKGDDRVTGGAGDDQLYGSSGADLLAGNSGDDDLRGDSGSDRLSGGSGKDLVQGYGGADRLSGGEDDDRLSGNSGNDRISGGSGRDRIWGRGGADRILARDGQVDRISCGDGVDTAVADERDRTGACET